jgi:hypothetical protein
VPERGVEKTCEKLKRAQLKRETVRRNSIVAAAVLSGRVHYFSLASTSRAL